MNRDKAIEIAATEFYSASPDEWAKHVVARADALLAVMGDDPDPSRCDASQRCVQDAGHEGSHRFDMYPCCAATEARVVREIVAWVFLRISGETCRSAKSEDYCTAYKFLADGIERGDWRAKGPCDE